MNRSFPWPAVALGAASLLAALWFLGPERETAVPASPSIMALEGPVSATPTRPSALEPRPVDPATAAHDVPEDPGVEELEVDRAREPEPEDRDQRIREGEERLQLALRGLEDPDRDPEEHRALRLQAAGALTQLRTRLSSTTEGRARWRAYAERLRTAAPG